MAPQITPARRPFARGAAPACAVATDCRAVLARSLRSGTALHCTARNVLYSRAKRLLPLIHPALNACSRCKDVASPLPPHICGDHRQLLYSALLRLPSSVRTSRSRKPPGPRHGGGPTEPPRPCGQAQLRTSGCAPSHLTRASPAACRAAGSGVISLFLTRKEDTQLGAHFCLM